MSVLSRYKLALIGTILAVIVISLILYFVWSPSKYSRHFQLYTDHSVHGLVNHSPVIFKGVKVGEVERVAIKGQTIIIRIGVNNEVPINQGTVAQIIVQGFSSRGFTGFTEIDLKQKRPLFSKIIKKPDEPLPTIPLKTNGSGSITETLNHMSRKVDLLVNLMQKALSEKMLEQLQVAAGSMTKLSKALTQKHGKHSSVIVSMSSAMSQFQPFVNASRHTLKTLNVQTLPALYGFMQSTKHLSDQLQKVLTELHHHPGVLIRGKKQAKRGPGE